MSLLTFLFGNPHMLQTDKNSLSRVTKIIAKHGGEIFSIEKKISDSNTYYIHFTATNKQYNSIVVDILALSSGLN